MGVGETISIDSASELRSDSEQLGVATYVAAVAFNSAALPANLPEFLKAAILDRAEQERDAAGDMLIDNRMNPDDARRRQAKTDADDDDNLSQFAQLVRQERQEREEWAHTKSTVGGVTMTGAEWSQLADRLRNDEDLHRRLIEVFEKRGMTEDEAETRYARVADVAAIAAIPEDQRTEAQTATFEKAKADPTFKQDMQDADHAAKIDAAPKSASSLSAEPSSPAEEGRPDTTVKDPPSPAERQIVAPTGPGF